MSGIYKESLRAYFLAEHDRERGIWRSKAHPEYVVRELPSGRVQVSDERSDSYRLYDAPFDMTADDVWRVVLIEWVDSQLPPIPDEDGVYVVKGTSLDNGPLVFIRYAGAWRCSPTIYGEAERVLELHRKTGFTKLTEAGS